MPSLRVGITEVSSALRVEGGYDSNLFGDPVDPVGDAYMVIAPSLSAQTDWARHAMTLSGRAGLTRFAENTRQNSNEYDLRAGARFDLPNTVIGIDIGTGQTVERRIVAAAPLSGIGVSSYDQTSQSLSVQHQLSFGGIGLRVSRSDIGYNDLVRADGTAVSQAFRDVRQWSVDTRATLAPTSSIAVHVTGGFVRSVATGPFARDSSGVSAAAGIGIDRGTFRVEGEAGVTSRRFSNPALLDFSGLTYRASASFYPTTLLTITTSIRRSIAESAVPTVGAIVTRAARVDVEYELLRSLLLRAYASRSVQRYRESDGSVILRRFTAEGEYSFNRIVSFGAYARSECRRPNATALASRFCAASTGFILTARR